MNAIKKLHIICKTRLLITGILCLLLSQLRAQNTFFLSGGTDDLLRRNQLISGGKPYSFTIRSFNTNKEAIDSLLPLTQASLFTNKKNIQSGYQPFSIESVYNMRNPYGWNDGSLVPSKGVSGKLSGGIFIKAGRLSIQLQPEIVVAQNLAFETFLTAYPDTSWSRYYQYLNRSDIPERFGEHTYKKIFGGQSSIRYNWNEVSAGISTENMWWGPAIRNALVMSNNAPGFLHATFNTIKPINTKMGSFEWQLVGGLLSNSGVLPPERNRRYTTGTSFLYVPKNDAQRYMTGLVLTWQPKWIKDLYLGFTKASYMYAQDIKSVADVLPLDGIIRSASEKDGKKASLGSLFIRYVLPQEMAEFYIEYGRNDKSPTPYNIIADDKYPRAYVAGMRKLFPARRGSFIEMTAELTQMQLPSSVTEQIRDNKSWYTHDYVRQGYTNMGQVMGAGIGPGSNSQMLGIAWVKGVKKVGVVFERLLHNNDLYYNLFEQSGDFRRHWIDLSTTVSADWAYQRFLFSARMSLVRALNYEYWYIDVVPQNSPANYFRNGYDVLNFNANFSFAYRL